LWVNYVNNENFEMFSCFSEFMSDNEIFDIKKIKDIILVRLKHLENNFNTLFEKFPEKKLGWIHEIHLLSILMKSILN